MVSHGASGKSDGYEQGTADASPSSPQQDSEADFARRHPLGHLTQDLAALQGYVLHYLAARSEAVTARIKKTVLWAVLGLAGGVAALTALVVAVVLVLGGAADGIASALGGRAWAGELIVGGVVLFVIALSAWIGLRYRLNLSRRRVKEQYERRRQHQRNAFGKDVAQRAAS